MICSPNLRQLEAGTNVSSLSTLRCLCIFVTSETHLQFLAANAAAHYMFNSKPSRLSKPLPYSASLCRGVHFRNAQPRGGCRGQGIWPPEHVRFVDRRQYQLYGRHKAIYPEVVSHWLHPSLSCKHLTLQTRSHWCCAFRELYIYLQGCSCPLTAQPPLK